MDQSPEGTVVGGGGVVEDGTGGVVDGTDEVEVSRVVVGNGSVVGTEDVEGTVVVDDVGSGSVVVGSVGGTVLASVVVELVEDGTVVVSAGSVVVEVVVAGRVVVDVVLVSGWVVVEATVEVVGVVQPAGCVAVASSESVAPLLQMAEAWKVSVVSANVFEIVNTNGTSSGCDGWLLTDHVSGRSASAVTVYTASHPPSVHSVSTVKSWWCPCAIEGSIRIPLPAINADATTIRVLFRFIRGASKRRY